MSKIKSEHNVRQNGNNSDVGPFYDFFDPAAGGGRGKGQRHFLVSARIPPH